MRGIPQWWLRPRDDWLRRSGVVMTVARLRNRNHGDHRQEVFADCFFQDPRICEATGIGIDVATGTCSCVAMGV